MPKHTQPQLPVLGNCHAHKVGPRLGHPYPPHNSQCMTSRHVLRNSPDSFVKQPYLDNLGPIAPPAPCELPVCDRSQHMHLGISVAPPLISRAAADPSYDFKGPPCYLDIYLFPWVQSSYILFMYMASTVLQCEREHTSAGLSVHTMNP